MGVVASRLRMLGNNNVKDSAVLKRKVDDSNDDELIGHVEPKTKQPRLLEVMEEEEGIVDQKVPETSTMSEEESVDLKNKDCENSHRLESEDEEEETQEKEQTVKLAEKEELDRTYFDFYK